MSREWKRVRKIWTRGGDKSPREREGDVRGGERAGE